MQIYVIGADGSPRVKIGRTRSLEQRLRSLQTGSPVPLRLLANFSADATAEARLHAEFQRFQVHGEWFEFPDGYDIVQSVADALRVIATSPPPRKVRTRKPRPKVEQPLRVLAPGELEALPPKERIRALREVRGFGRVRLAAELGVSRQTVHALETGAYQASLPLAFHIARYFDLPVASIFKEQAATDRDRRVTKSRP